MGCDFRNRLEEWMRPAEFDIRSTSHSTTEDGGAHAENIKASRENLNPSLRARDAQKTTKIHS